jgi:EmrB/QacA subfamily drug resistance transporter
VTSTEPAPTGATTAQRWVLALTAVGSFMVILDMLVVATALTAIQRDLHASMADLEWTVNAYTLSFAVLLMTAASLGDRYGRRRIFTVGLALFSLSSVACALAPNVGALVAARAVQGVGAAAVMPLALGLLNAAFPPQRRGWALGIFGSVTGLAAALGPIIGGSLTQGLAWQWIFWINVPVGLITIPLVFKHIPESRGPAAQIDIPGLVLFTPAAVGLVWALVRSDAAGWSSAEVLGALGAGVVLTAAFLRREAMASAPMLPLRLFRSPAFSAGNTIIFLLNATMTGSIFFMTQYQQVALGHGPLAAGLRLLPWGLPPLLLATRSGALADRLGEKPLVLIGMLLQAVGMGWIAIIATGDVSYWQFLVPMALGGVGFTFAIPAVTKAVISSGAREDIGKASGAYSTMRQLGGAFGVAVLSAAFTARGSYLSPDDFSKGVRVAFAVAAGMALAGAATAWALPGRRSAAAPAVTPAGAPEPTRTR